MAAIRRRSSSEAARARSISRSRSARARRGRTSDSHPTPLSKMIRASRELSMTPPKARHSWWLRWLTTSYLK
ncbi:MAG TPA: hypothetical protein VFW50_46250 [Streptosporangiaceae bacterium]|nr:hypothetical protein [Streptosporangiaceae bacterium]